MYAGTWSASTATPPGNNVDAPVNIGTTAQIKEGNFGVNTLSVVGNLGVTDGNITIKNIDPSTNSYLKVTNINTGNDAYLGLVSSGGADLNINASSSGYIKITAAAPFIDLYDTDAGSLHSRIAYAQTALHFQAGRNGDNTLDNPDPLILQVGATSSEDYAKFSEGVLANAFCSRNGNVCFTATDIKNLLSETTVNAGGANSSLVNGKAVNSQDEFNLYEESSCTHVGSNAKNRTYISCPAGKYVAGVTFDESNMDLLCCPFYPEPASTRSCYVEFSWKTTIAEYSGGPENSQTGSATRIISGAATDLLAIGMFVASDFYEVTSSNEFTNYTGKMVNRTGGYAGCCHEENSSGQAEYVSMGFWKPTDYVSKKTSINSIVSANTSANDREAIVGTLQMSPGKTVTIKNLKNHSDDPEQIKAGWEQYTVKVIDCSS